MDTHTKHIYENLHSGEYSGQDVDLLRLLADIRNARAQDAEDAARRVRDAQRNTTRVCGVCGSDNLDRNCGNVACGSRHHRCRDCGADYCEYEQEWSGGDRERGLQAQYDRLPMREKLAQRVVKQERKAA